MRAGRGRREFQKKVSYTNVTGGSSNSTGTAAMSGIGDLFRINRVVQPECPLYEEVPLSYFLVLGDFYPIILSFGTFIWNFVKKREAFAFAFSTVLVLDWLLNLALQAIWNQSGPFYQCGCGHHWEMPSFASQHITVFVLIVFVFAGVWGGGLSLGAIAMLSSLQFLVLFARIYIGISTSEQLLMGLLVAMAEGIVVIVLMRFLVLPYFLRLYMSALAKRLGVVDTLLIPIHYCIRHRHRADGTQFSVLNQIAHDRVRYRAQMTDPEQEDSETQRLATLLADGNSRK